MKTNWKIKTHGSEFKLMRLQETAPLHTGTMDTPGAASAYIRPLFEASLRYSPDTETFAVLLLNTRRRAIGFEVVSNGTVDTLLVHPREVFRAAIVMNASAIVLAHNHPSGEVTPSEGDVKVTRDLIKAGQIIKIDVLDHIILGRLLPDQKRDYCSLRELGYFYS